MPAESNAPLMTHNEMRKAFDGEWVLIVDYELDPDRHDISRGRVIAHSVDRKEVEAADRHIRPVDAAYECFRDPGEGTTLIL